MIKPLYFLYSVLKLYKLFIFAISAISYSFIRYIQKLLSIYIDNILSFFEKSISFSIKSIIISHSFLNDFLFLSSSNSSISLLISFLLSRVIPISILNLLSFKLESRLIGSDFSSLYFLNIFSLFSFMTYKYVSISLIYLMTFSNISKSLSSSCLLFLFSTYFIKLS